MRALIFEEHCEARGANFSIFQSNARKFLHKQRFSGKIPECGFRVPNRKREICENVARNGFRLLLGSARLTLIVPDCGLLRGFVAKVRGNCARAQN